MRALLNHLGKHIVGRTVHDALNGLYMIGSQTVAQCTDDRNTTRGACLIHQRDIARNLLKLIAMVCQQCLVGSHNCLAIFQCSLDQGIGLFYSTHQLHYNINLGIINHLGGVIRKCNADTAILGEIFDHTCFDHNPLASSCLNDIGIGFEYRSHTCTDSAYTEYTYLNHAVFPLRLFLKIS